MIFLATYDLEIPRTGCRRYVVIKDHGHAVPFLMDVVDLLLMMARKGVTITDVQSVGYIVGIQNLGLVLKCHLVTSKSHSQQRMRSLAY